MESPFTWLGLGVASLTGRYWFNKVSQTVPDWYLDEEFHIRQAQAYCKGQWDVWDPKLTTPPGLYGISVLARSVFGTDCAVESLRWVNFITNSAVISLVAGIIYKYVHSRNLGPSRTDIRPVLIAFDISFFPLLFFFSALYYTDVGSTCCVLACYAVFLSGNENRTSIFRKAALVLLGILSLSFRQTNIFWVVVFLGGLDVVHALNRKSRGSVRPMDSSFLGVVRDGWRYCDIYDPPARDAYLEDYLKTGLSLVVAVLANLGTVLVALTPYFVLLAGFVAFIIWNGGVVLGHKAYHTATIHAPQMLYIWIFFAFFSAPLLYPYILEAIHPPTFYPATFRHLGVSSNPKSRPRVALIAASLLLILATIHFNTIIHPFTLADNRHYVFYLFHWFIMPRPWAKYLAAPIYLLCGWTALRALSAPTKAASLTSSGGPPTREIKPPSTAPPSETKVSFVLIFLAAATLSLISAPLVEPRYFIIPWVLWRLHLPIVPFRPQPGKANRTRRTMSDRIVRSLSQYWPLALETAWFLAINAATGYVFLYRGFEWPQEPGRVQRFLW